MAKLRNTLTSISGNGIQQNIDLGHVTLKLQAQL